MDAKLVVVGGETKAGEYQLSLPTIIGRSRGTADLTIANPLVSRQHCELFEANGVLMVRDLGSLNGTFIGEKRLTQESQLGPGELLTVGAVTFKAVYGQANAAPAAAPKAGGKSDETPARAKSAEVEQTREAGGLADLERMRDLQAEPADQESEEDFDLGWLEEDEDSSNSEAKSEVAPRPAAQGEPDELELETEEAAPINKPDKSRSQTGEETVRAKDASTGEETIQFAPPDKSGNASDEDDLNEFFKNLE